MKEKIKVVIVGGGFSGLTVLRKLLKSQEGKSELTLIDKSPEFWFKTRLIDFFNDESEDNAAIERFLKIKRLITFKPRLIGLI